MTTRAPRCGSHEKGQTPCPLQDGHGGPCRNTPPERKPETDQSAVRVACSACGALPGLRCKTPTGAWSVRPHAPRRKKAETQGALDHDAALDAFYDVKDETPFLVCAPCGSSAVPARLAAEGPLLLTEPKRLLHSHTDGTPLCPVVTGPGYQPSLPVLVRGDGTTACRVCQAAHDPRGEPVCACDDPAPPAPGPSLYERNRAEAVLAEAAEADERAEADRAGYEAREDRQDEERREERLAGAAALEAAGLCPSGCPGVALDAPEEAHRPGCPERSVCPLCLVDSDGRKEHGPGCALGPTPGPLAALQNSDEAEALLDEDKPALVALVLALQAEKRVAWASAPLWVAVVEGDREPRVFGPYPTQPKAVSALLEHEVPKPPKQGWPVGEEPEDRLEEDGAWTDEESGLRFSVSQLGFHEKGG